MAMIFSCLADYARTDEGVFQYREIKELLNLEKHGERVFYRDFFPGHFTGSALIVDTALERILLTYHRKLDKWLQLGGHADGESRIWQVALREAQEESGIKEIYFHTDQDTSIFPPPILD